MSNRQQLTQEQMDQLRDRVAKALYERLVPESSELLRAAWRLPKYQELADLAIKLVLAEVTFPTKGTYQ